MTLEEGKRRRARRRLIAVGTFVLVLALAVGFLCLREPRIEGRALSDWLVDLVSPEAPKREAATQVIQKHGPALTPELLPYLRERKSLLLTLIYKSPKTTLWMRKWAPNLEQRAQIEMGTFRTLLLLAPGNKSIVPALIGMLSERSPETSIKAAWILSAVGPKAEEAVPQLTSLLGDTHSTAFVRTAAARALGEIGRPTTRAILGLIRALSVSETGLVTETVNALGKFGQRAQQAVPALLTLLDQAYWGPLWTEKSPPRVMADVVAKAIAKIGLEDTTNALQLIRICRVRSEHDRFRSINILAAAAAFEKNLDLLIQICRDPTQKEEDRLAALRACRGLAREKPNLITVISRWNSRDPSSMPWPAH